MQDNGGYCVFTSDSNAYDFRNNKAELSGKPGFNNDLESTTADTS